MANSETVQSSEMEQQESHQIENNDKLLNKYVIARTNYFPSSSKALIVSACSLTGFILLGLGAIVLLDVQWPVIVALCLVIVASCISELIIAIPLGKGNLTVASSQDLKRILLDYKKHDLISSAIFIPLWIAVSVWLAFALRDISFVKSEGLENYAFWCTLAVFSIPTVGDIISTCYRSKTIDSIIEDVEKRNYNKIQSTLQM